VARKLPDLPGTIAAGVTEQGICNGQSRLVGRLLVIILALTPRMEVNPETYEVRADGKLLNCEPAKVLPMAQRYFLY
jgi:urease subunit alpha